MQVLLWWICFSLVLSCRIWVGFFSVYHIENHSMYVIQYSLVKVLNLSVLLYWKMWAFCMRLNTFRNTEEGTNRKVPSAAFHAVACIGDCPAYGCASQLFWFWNSSVVTLAPGWKEIDIWKILSVLVVFHVIKQVWMKASQHHIRFLLFVDCILRNSALNRCSAIDINSIWPVC